MKKINLVLSVLVVLLVLAGCDKNPAEVKEKDPINENNVITIEPLLSNEVDITQNNFLDTIFSEKNKLIPNEWQMGDSNIYIINSLEELDAINSFGYQVNIDWNKYTLIGGRLTAVMMLPKLDIPTSLLEQENSYLLNITIDYSQGGYSVMDNLYFWRLYPKLKDDKMVNVKITRIPIGG